MKLLLSCIVILLSMVSVFPSTYAQNDEKAKVEAVSKLDLIVYNEYMDSVKKRSFKNKTDLLQYTAEFFLDKPYVAGTLDVNDEEELVINMREFDCVTYIETVIALANTVDSGNIKVEEYAKNLLSIRYITETPDEYNSRLHYTSDWVFVNTERGILKPIAWQDENVLEDKTINFMSQHRHAYKALREDDDMLYKIVAREDIINKRGGFTYLPKSKIAGNEDKIPHMAMIAFTTRIEGLDTTHTGFAYRKKDGTLSFIHASSLKNKVVIDEKSLSDYCKSQKACKGLLIMEVQ